jgi:hypothetical protein
MTSANIQNQSGFGRRYNPGSEIPRNNRRWQRNNISNPLCKIQQQTEIPKESKA